MPPDRIAYLLIPERRHCPIQAVCTSFLGLHKSTFRGIVICQVLQIARSMHECAQTLRLMMRFSIITPFRMTIILIMTSTQNTPLNVSETSRVCSHVLRHHSLIVHKSRKICAHVILGKTIVTISSGRFSTLPHLSESASGPLHRCNSKFALQASPQ